MEVNGEFCSLPRYSIGLRGSKIQDTGLEFLAKAKPLIKGQGQGLTSLLISDWPNEVKLGVIY